VVLVHCTLLNFSKTRSVSCNFSCSIQIWNWKDFKRSASDTKLRYMIKKVPFFQWVLHFFAILSILVNSIFYSLPQKTCENCLLVFITKKLSAVIWRKRCYKYNLLTKTWTNFLSPHYIGKCLPQTLNRCEIVLGIRHSSSHRGYRNDKNRNGASFNRPLFSGSSYLTLLSTCSKEYQGKSNHGTSAQNFVHEEISWLL